MSIEVAKESVGMASRDSMEASWIVYDTCCVGYGICMIRSARRICTTDRMERECSHLRIDKTSLW